MDGVLQAGADTFAVVNCGRGTFRLTPGSGMPEKVVFRAYDGQQEFDIEERRGKELEETARVVGNMDFVIINGTQLLLNQIYDSIDFNRIPDDILRHLIIARVS